MKKKVLAGILMMILVLASVMTVSAATSPSPTKGPHVKYEDEKGFYKVDNKTPFAGETYTNAPLNADVKKAIEDYNADKITLDKLLADAPKDVKAALKGKTDISGVFDLVPVNDGQPNADGSHTVTVTVPGVDKAKDVVVLHFNRNDNTWEILKATVSGEKVTATYETLSPVAVFGVVEAGGADGESPKTVGTSSAWMLMAAVALVAVGTGVVVSQKKNR